MQRAPPDGRPRRRRTEDDHPSPLDLRAKTVLIAEIRDRTLIHKWRRKMVTFCSVLNWRPLTLRLSRHEGSLPAVRNTAVGPSHSKRGSTLRPASGPSKV